MDLFEIARLVGDSFSVQFLFTTLIEFVAFTSHAYYCFNGLTKMYLYDRQPDLYDMITTTLWAISRILQFFTVAFACKAVKDEVSSNGLINTYYYLHYNVILNRNVF